MKFFGEANLQKNYLRDAVIPLDSAFPQDPVVGHIVFKNRILYICVEIVDNTPVWVPLTNEITAYKHIQNTTNTTWAITHPLNTSHISVTTYDDDGYMIIPNEVRVVDNSTVNVTFSSTAQGTAVVLSGHIEGQIKPTYAFEHYQTAPSDTWVITHGLGRYPIVRVFIGNQEVQPETITFDTLNQVTITFSSAQVGEVKLI